MVWTLRPDHQSRTAEAPSRNTNPLRTLKIFFDRASKLTRPAILDMGPACSSNIELFGQKGFKIYVEDFLNDYLDTKHIQDPRLLNYSDGTFAGILCWDIFDFMTPGDAERLIRRLFSLLKEGGGIVALFDARTDTKTKRLTRHKIIGEDLVSHEPIQEIRSIAHHYKNREILQLFGDFEIIKSYYHKNSQREYFFQKSRIL